MVNYGVSRACQPCRTRHKKCDEIQPTCRRCMRSGRACHYRDVEDALFRHYTPSWYPKQPLLSFKTWPSEVDDDYLEEHALEGFVRDFIVRSQDPRFSRGFLDGSRQLLEVAGPSSDIAQAATIVGMACVGNRLHRPTLIRKAAQSYGRLLQSFQESLPSASTDSTVQDLLMAVLLGLYEIVSSTEECPLHHIPHVRGVCAILSSDRSPFDFSAGIQLFQLANSLLLNQPLQQPKAPGVLCMPTSNETVRNLDAILMQCNKFFSRAEKVLVAPDPSIQSLQDIYEDALGFHSRFLRWAESQSAEWLPRSNHNISNADARLATCDYCWPGSIDSYMDLYVAAAWNSYRKTHLMVIDVLVRCTNQLGYDNQTLHKQAEILMGGIIASIPYFLAADLEQYVKAIRGKGQVIIGRPVGGLLLLHPLYVATKCSIVSPSLQRYFTKCLSWIGHNMGIGQARLLAKPFTNLPFQEMAEGHIIIWAGMLFCTVPDKRAFR